MLLSTKGRYAVMAVVEIAKQRDGSPLPLAKVSERLELSLDYLEQLFMKLRRGGVVESVRGPGGGYVLSRPASTISVGEIMTAAGEPFKLTRCAGESEAGCVAARRCTTHYLWDALGAHIEQFLANATLEDVLGGRYSAPREFWLTRLTVGAELVT